MERLQVDGGELEYETAGTGEPLVLIHGGIIGDASAPLLREASLTGRYQVTNYHRRGFLGSSSAPRPFSIAGQAADALAVIGKVAGGRAHVAGYSFGGPVAVQLIMDAPEAVHSLAILEMGLNVPSAAAFAAQTAPARALYGSGDKSGTVDAFLSARIGSGYRASINRTLAPGWFDAAVADLDTAFEVEGPALAQWQFTPEMAQRITQPVLAVLGADSNLLSRESDALLRQLVPHAEPFVLQGASHGLHLQNPGGMAEVLAAFLARHPMSLPAPA